MARIEPEPRPKVLQSKGNPPKKGRKRRKGKTLITKAVEKLTAVLKKPQSTNIEKAEAYFKVTHAKMKAYEQEEEGRGK